MKQEFLVGVGAALGYVLWNAAYASLPESYAVCSSEGTIYTVDEAHPTAHCLLVSHDKISAVGTEDHVKAVAGQEKLRLFDIQPGSIVVPGLADAHAHIIEYGFKVQLQLDGSSSISEVIKRIKSYLDAHPDVSNDPTRWIEGMGWDQNRWEPQKFPTAFDLSQDPTLRSRFVTLKRIDGHAVWVSQAVLDLMEPLPDIIEGGEIIRDFDGKPTGIFLDNAMSLVPLPKRTPSMLREYFDTTMQDAVKVGLTSIHEASGEDQNIDFYKKVAEQGDLPIRVYLMRSGPPVHNTQVWDSIRPLMNYGKDGRLNMQSVKLFMDGALGSWGAALLSPYSDQNTTNGILLVEPEVMEAQVRHAWETGWQVNIHAIGDRANKIVIDIFEGIELSDKGSIKHRRPRIEHSQIMRIEDLQRSGRLGVISSVQPTHATSDMRYAESRLGPERIKGAYAYQSLLQNSPNHILPLGSDFPIEGINPLLGFYAAVSRLSESGESPHGKDGWYASEGLTRAQALKGMTLDAAYASFSENEVGSLQVGKKADFVILNLDIMKIPISKVLETKVQATVVDGQLAYGSLDHRNPKLGNVLLNALKDLKSWIVTFIFA